MSEIAREDRQIGSVLPDFTLPLVTAPDQQWSLHEQARRGRGAAIIFWSGVCSHCERYDAYFNAFSAQHPEIAFAAVAARQTETIESAKAVLEARGLHFLTIHDKGSAIAQLLFTQHTPRVFLVDHEARLVYRGAIDNFKYPVDPEYVAYLEPAVEALLAGRPVERPDTPSFGCAIQSVYYTIQRPIARKPLTPERTT